MRISLASTSIPDLLPTRDRSLGLHVSDVIHDLACKMGYREHRDDNSISPDEMSRLQLGCALEHAIADRYSLEYPDRYISIGEQCEDGLYYTPDLYDVIYHAIDEIKLTWASSRWWPDTIDSVDLSQLSNDIVVQIRKRYVLDRAQPKDEKYWAYLAQLKYYCYGIRTQLGRLHVCHVNGAYRDFRVDYRKFEIEFEMYELVENRNMIVNHARQMIKEGWTR